MDLLFLLPRVFLHCLSSYTVIDFSAIDCGFLLLCRSAGRGLLSAVSSRQLRKAPCAERDNESHFVFVTFPRPLDFLLKTPFWALAPFRRRASGAGIFFSFFLRGCLSVRGTVPSVATSGSRWASMSRRSFLVKYPPILLPVCPPVLLHTVQ